MQLQANSGRLRAAMRALVLFSYLCLCSCSITEAPEAPKLSTVGWLEEIVLSPPGIILQAKLDTGADYCSVHASDISEFDQNDRRWVRFNVSNRYGTTETVERRVTRTARIKTKAGGIQVRPVVRLGICLGSNFEIVECNLVDRSKFKYPVLIGRNFLSGSVTVNASETYTSRPQCTPAA